jgi:hypothetical protein
MNKKLPTWKGLPLFRAKAYGWFESIKGGQGYSRFDMSNDDNIKRCLREAFELGKKYGRMGMKIKHKL